MYQPPAWLNQGAKYTYQAYNDDGDWYTEYRMYLPDAPAGWDEDVDTFWELIKLGQISMNFNGNLHSSNHRHVIIGRTHGKEWDLAMVKFSSDRGQFAELVSDPNNIRTAWNPSELGWTTIPKNVTSYISVRFTHSMGDRCWCGASGVQNPVVTFADNTMPRVTSVKVDGNQYYYNSGAITFTVYFSEPIRFRDGKTTGKVADTSNRINLNAYNRKDLTSVDAYAELTEVGENYLKYKYTCPTEGADIIITGLAPKERQTSALLTRDNYLYVYTNPDGNPNKYDSYENPMVNGRWLRVNSTFTDLAGNGIDEKWTGYSFSHEIHVDTEKPSTSSVTMTGSMMKDEKVEGYGEEQDGWPEDIDRSQVFAGVGDSVTLNVWFNEELSTFDGQGAASGSEDAGHFTATLNVLDESGENVKVTGASIHSEQQGGGNWIKASVLTFEPLVIETGMKPDNENPGPIKIIGLECDGPVADMCGNEIEASDIANIPAPNQQEWLDTLAPKVNITKESNSDDGEQYTFKIAINEDEYRDSEIDNPKNYQSGVESVGDKWDLQEGAIVYVLGEYAGAKYQYQLTDSPEPTDGGWQDASGSIALAYVQTIADKYIHIKKVECDVPLMNVVVRAVGHDYAGNEAVGEYSFEEMEDGKKVVFSEDTLPEVSATFDRAADGVRAKMLFKDAGGLDKVYYKIVVKDFDDEDAADTDPDAPTVETIKSENPAEVDSDWTVEDRVNGGNWTAIETWKDETCTAKKFNRVYVCMYAVDVSGNETYDVVSVDVNLTVPSFAVTLPEEAVTSLSAGDKQALKTDELKADAGTGIQDAALFVTVVPKDMEVDDSRNDKSLTILVDQIKAADDGSVEHVYTYEGIENLLNGMTATEGREAAEDGTTNVVKGFAHYGNNYSLGTIPEDPSSQKDVFNDYNAEWTEEIINKFQTYYGDVDVYVTVVKNPICDPSGSSFYYHTDEGVLYSAQLGTFKMRMSDDSGNKYNVALFGIPTAANGEALGNVQQATDHRVDLSIEYAGYKDDIVTAFKTLEGVTVPFTLTNGRVPEWGVEDIDPEKSKVEVYYAVISYYEEEFNGEFATKVYEENLETDENGNVVAAQQFVFPAAGEDGIEYDNVAYMVKVKLVRRSDSNVTEEFWLDDYPFKVNTFEPDENGGFKSIYIVDGTTLARNTGYQRVAEWAIDNGYEGKSIDSYTIPVIDSIEYGSKSERDYFFPFVTYQTALTNDKDTLGYKRLIGGYPGMVLLAWLEDENGQRTEVMTDSTCYTPSTDINTDNGMYYNCLRSVEKPGFTFGFQVSTAKNTYDYEGIPEDSTRNFEIEPGHTVTLCVQEAYSNGEKSSVRKISVTAPAELQYSYTDEAEKARIESVSPNVDVSWYDEAGIGQNAAVIPTPTVEIRVNDISSLNGIKDIYVAKGDSYNWELISGQYFDAEVTEVEDGRKLLKIDGKTTFGDNEETSKFLKDLVIKGGKSTERTTLIAVDNNANMTIMRMDILEAWDPFSPQIEIYDGSTGGASGKYDTMIDFSDQFSNAVYDDNWNTVYEGMTLYITTVDPRIEPEGDTGDAGGEDEPQDMAGSVTDTIIIPWSDIPFNYDEEGLAAFRTPYDGTTMNTPGIYSITAEGLDAQARGADWSEMYSSDDNPSYAVKGTIRIEGTLPKEAVYIYCTDELGNMSNIKIIGGSGNEAVKPELVGGPVRDETDETLSVGFTQAVSIKSILDPEGREIELPDGSEKLTVEKSGLPIYKDGTYTVVYRNIFGDEFTTELDVALDEKWLSYHYDTNPSTVTNGSVESTLEETIEYGFGRVTGARVTYDDDTTGTASVTDEHKVTATLTQNGYVEVDFEYGEGSEPQKTTKRFPIKNIDKVMAQVEVLFEYGSEDVYVYNEEDGRKQVDEETGEYVLQNAGYTTNGLVTAVVVVNDEEQPDEELVGQTRYTFPNGSAQGDTFEFEFTDAAGNAGTATATLPYNIQLPTPTRMTSVSVTGTLLRSDNSTIGNNDMSYRLEYEAEDAGKMFKDGEATVKAYKDNLTVTADVDAAVRVVPYETTDITADTASGEVEGVTVSGRTVQVTQNAQFKIVVVEDSKYYEAAQDTETYTDENSDRGPQKVYVIPVTVENITGIGEVAVTSVRISNFLRRAYFDPLENTDLTLTNDKTEIKFDESNGKWYREFRAGGDRTYTFTYRDSVGNTGSTVARIDDLPTSDDVIVEGGQRWWPYDGTDQTKLSEKPVNFDVTVQTQFNMMISKAALYETNSKDGDELDGDRLGFTVNITMDLVTVTFSQNLDIENLTLWVQGETEKEMFVKLGPVTTIDKEEPGVEKSDESAPARTTTVTFTPDEDVICKELPRSMDVKGGYYTADDPLVVEFTANGDYTYTFVDKAGNETVVTGEIKNIDRDAPTVVFSADGTGEGSDWATFAEAMGDWVQRLNENGATDFYIKATDVTALSCQVQNQKKVELTSGVWAPVKIDRAAGGFALSVTDAAGNATTVELTGIRIADVTAPVLTVSPQNLSVSEEDVADTAKLAQLLEAGVTVTDDSDKYNYAEKVTWDYAPKTLPATPGEYTVTYTATDWSGNTSTSVRYVRVYSATSLMVRVGAEGDGELAATGYMNTTIVKSGRFTVEVSNLENDGKGNYKPCQVYIKRGFKTPGQMKNGSEIIPATERTALATGDGFRSEYTVTGSGYYTLYIVAQDRTQYLTYLYIEQ